MHLFKEAEAQLQRTTESVLAPQTHSPSCGQPGLYPFGSWGPTIWPGTRNFREPSRSYFPKPLKREDPVPDQPCCPQKHYGYEAFQVAAAYKQTSRQGKGNRERCCCCLLAHTVGICLSAEVSVQASLPGREIFPRKGRPDL